MEGVSASESACVIPLGLFCVQHERLQCNVCIAMVCLGCFECSMIDCSAMYVA